MVEQILENNVFESIVNQGKTCRHSYGTINGVCVQCNKSVVPLTKYYDVNARKLLFTTLSLTKLCFNFLESEVISMNELWKVKFGKRMEIVDFMNEQQLDCSNSMAGSDGFQCYVFYKKKSE